MKFIADENLGVQVPHYLKELGLDIISVKDIAQGEPDTKVLQIANEEKRILITLDKDFGELVFKQKLIHSGVILLRLKDESVNNKKRVLLKALKSRRKFMNKFSVVRDIEKRVS